MTATGPLYAASYDVEMTCYFFAVYCLLSSWEFSTDVSHVGLGITWSTLLRTAFVHITDSLLVIRCFVVNQENSHGLFSGTILDNTEFGGWMLSCSRNDVVLVGESAATILPAENPMDC